MFFEEFSDKRIIDERTIRDKIYEVRGVKVMLDFELAEIYGYETKNFNRQVENISVDISPVIVRIPKDPLVVSDLQPPFKVPVVP